MIENADKCSRIKVSFCIGTRTKYMRGVRVWENGKQVLRKNDRDSNCVRNSYGFDVLSKLNGI